MRVMDVLVGTALYDIGGLKMLLSPHRLIDSYIIRHGSYAPELVSFIRAAMADGGAFIDVGANIGYLSLIAARAGGSRSRIYSFEPSPREYASLLDHLVLNAVMNVVPYPYGIGSHPETSVLGLAGLDNSGRNSRFLNADAGAVADVEIKLAPIDSFLAADAIRDVRCVKIDVEGDEWFVLQGFAKVMPLLKEATFLVEISPYLLQRSGHSVDEVYDFFETHGFRACRAIRPGVEQWDELFVAATARTPSPVWFDAV